MLRNFYIIILLFILSSCADSIKTQKTNVIPSQNITSESLAPFISDEKQINIALLVPFENSKNHIGSSIINATKIAIAEINNSDINLVLINSSLISQDPDLLLQKLQSNKIKAIIGPLFSKETQNLIELTSKMDIPILSLSNDTSLNGNNLLIMGPSPAAQATILTKYAIAKSINQFYLALPSNKYGKIIEEAITEEINQKTNITYSTTWYNPKDPSHTIDSLVASLAGKQNSNKALFMPQGGEILNILNASLEKHKLKINLIGSKSWDNKEILNFSYFNGALIILKNDNKEQLFFSEYKQLFHEEANNLEFITYNSLKLLAKMIKEDQNLDKNNIIQNNPEQFDSHGTSIYKMPIAEISQKQFKFIE